MVSALAFKIPNVIVQLDAYGYVFIEIIRGVQLVG